MSHLASDCVKNLYLFVVDEWRTTVEGMLTLFQKYILSSDPTHLSLSNVGFRQGTWHDFGRLEVEEEMGR